MNLYITADQIGIQTGGGGVTHHESEALKGLGAYDIVDRKVILERFDYLKNAPEGSLWHGFTWRDPWSWDEIAGFVKDWSPFDEVRLAHFYAGTFSATIDFFRRRNPKIKITYTAAAHDVKISKKAHEMFGFEYNYPHLTDPELFERYVRGYLAADVLICPSVHSANVMRRFGAKNRIEIIPHGCHIPEAPIANLPEQFTVGYLGTACAPDKGVPYLLAAWKAAGLKDSKLVIAGADSQSELFKQFVDSFGGGNIELRGWINNVSDFYNSISLYVQPSMTEGFGLEVLEANAHGRPVLCSLGAGAIDIACGQSFVAGDAHRLTLLLRGAHENYHKSKSLKRDHPKDVPDYLNWCIAARASAEQYSWDKIRQRYIKLWKELLV